MPDLEVTEVHEEEWFGNPINRISTSQISKMIEENKNKGELGLARGMELALDVFEKVISYGGSKKMKTDKLFSNGGMEEVNA